MGTASSQEEAPTKYGGLELENGAVIGVYLDPSQGDSDGQIILTQRAAENYNPWTADRRKKEVFEGETLTCSSFRAKSVAGSVIAAGTESGKLLVMSASTFEPIKTVIIDKRSNRSDASEGVEMSQAGGAAGPRRVTALLVAGDNFLVCGDSQGATRFYRISSGDDFLTIPYAPPESNGHSDRTRNIQSEDEPGGSPEVVALATLRIQPRRDDPAVSHALAIGHENGRLLIYTLKGELIRVFEGGPSNLLTMVHARNLGTLACLYVGNNVIWAWDIDTGIPQVLEFNQELQALNQQQAVATCMTYDVLRDVLITGSNDGSFFIRKLHKDPETKSFASRYALKCFYNNICFLTPQGHYHFLR